MAEYSRFFGGPEGDVPEYTQPQFAEVLEKLFSNGVFTDVDDELAVSENDPVSLSVIVASGEGWINGFWYQNTEDLTKTLGAADPDNPRIDRIILRLDTTDDFEITCEVLEGTPAADPDPPELTQTAATYEISLCQVLVAEDATSVADEDITDEREYAIVPNTVDLISEQTLTNKTLTKPVINGTNPTGATYTPDSGAQVVALDCAANNMHIVTGHADGTAITFTVANATNNQPFIVSILQGAVVSTIAAWFATVRWPDGVTPTLTPTVGKRDWFGFIRTGANTYDGFIVGQNL